MKIDFWFDPACPWCWLTSRWVETVVPKRDLEITWRSISLFFKNNPDPDHRLYEPTLWSRNLLRVVEAVREAGHEDRVELGQAGRTLIFDILRIHIFDIHTRLCVYAGMTQRFGQ